MKFKRKASKSTTSKNLTWCTFVKVYFFRNIRSYVHCTMYNLKKYIYIFNQPVKKISTDKYTPKFVCKILPVVHLLGTQLTNIYLNLIVHLKLKIQN